MLAHQKMYQTIEFGWAYLSDLSLRETYLIETYLDKTGKTVDAGTGGGRILLSLKTLGFNDLYGFDFVPEFIEVAKQRDASHSIVYDVKDATCLDYQDNFFDQILYLEQIICCIEDDSARFNALKQAHRILKKGGIALFSFLSFDARIRSPMYLPCLVYLSLLRKLCKSQHSIQYLPCLKLGRKAGSHRQPGSGTFNWLALLDRPPYTYWYKLQEAYQVLRAANFEVVAIGSDYQISQNKMHLLPETLVNQPLQGMLYFVCKK
mgnify:CR=1 FL=1